MPNRYRIGKVDADGMYRKTGSARIFTTERAAIAAVKGLSENPIKAGDTYERAYRLRPYGYGLGGGLSTHVFMKGYLLSNQYYLSAHSWSLLVIRLMKGKRFSDIVKGFLHIQPVYLSAAFETIDRGQVKFG